LIHDHISQRDRVDQIKEEAKAGHQPASDVLIPTNDRSLRTADAFVAFEDTMSRALTELREPCNIIPETNDAKLKAAFFKMSA
jgi:hypothetical protein